MKFKKEKGKNKTVKKAKKLRLKLIFIDDSYI